MKHTFILVMNLMFSCSENILLLTETDPLLKRDGLAIRLEFEKTHYKASEPIFAYVSIQNTSNKPFFVNARLDANFIYQFGDLDVWFSITPDFRDKKVTTLHQRRVTPDDFVLLKPDERVFRPESVIVSSMTDGMNLPIGRYTLKAYYQNRFLLPDFKQSTIWTGIVESDEYLIEILP